ncbi:MAG: hypothetical protein OJF51_000327 [Nitrospira sp.]|jgi:hypothetical protein|nr:MAG: hypothetical protein OJF51_000327 [Nitrospira sp.]
MSLPRFTAEASLYKTNVRYQTSGRVHTPSMRIISRMYPAMMDETIEVFGCRPGFLQLGEGENMTCIPDPSWAGSGGSSVPGGPSDSGGGGGGVGTGDPAIEVPCPPGLQPNPNYDRDICRECKKECDIAHPLEPCEGSDTWCNAINAEALRERRKCYGETCGWRCASCA